ncbi:MAG: hypothetical protein LUH11_04285 [Candidatus Gastranaerophilales bacterium]|nr:hypothetical protein [Candidatus Gastranaerophilales bacterium]
MDKTELDKLFYIDKNYSGIKELTANNLDDRSFNMLGKINLWNGNLVEAYKYFKQSQYIFGCAYCKLMEEEIEEAKIILKDIKNQSSAVNWLLCLVNIIENNDYDNPTYFQIRNFYEQDLNMFFLYKRKKYIEKVIGANSYFEHFNREVYKYSARVLFNNNYLELAEKLLKKSLNIFYKDAETHFMLGEIYYKKKEIEKAKIEYIQSNKVNGNYGPAINRLSKLNN